MRQEQSVHSRAHRERREEEVSSDPIKKSL